MEFDRMSLQTNLILFLDDRYIMSRFSMLFKYLIKLTNGLVN